MAELTFILGKSGVGKSFSLRGFDKDEVCVYSVASKKLPFKEGLDMNVAKTHSYKTIKKHMQTKSFNVYVVDDANYLMGFESMKRAKETGFQKFVDMATDFFDLVQFCINDMPDDTTVYFFMHTQDEDGYETIKTSGQMLKNQINLEGLVNMVLLCEVNPESDDVRDRVFLTQSDGTNAVKTPFEMFDSLMIPNQLKIVDDAQRAYWGMPPRKKYTKEEATKTDTKPKKK